jgi:hypothetical protein
MSGTFPSTAFTATNFRINSPAQSNETFNGKVRRVGLGISYYTFTVKFPPLTRVDAGPIIGFLGQQYGIMENFQILLPNESYPVANYSYTSPYVPTVAATIDKGAKSVTLKGCYPDATILRSGDYFKFNTHSKVYMCATTCVANGSGNATLYFSGSAIRDVSVDVGLTVNAVPFTVMLSNEMQEYETGLGRMVNIEFDVREDIQPL